MTNSTLMLTNGVCVSSWTNYGILLRPGGKFVSEGTPDVPIHAVSYAAVQEGYVPSTGSITPAQVLIPEGSTTNLPSIQARFTDWVLMGNKGWHLQSTNGSPNAAVGLKDCSFHGGGLLLRNLPVSVTNCLMDRVIGKIRGDTGSQELILYNNLWLGGSLWIGGSAGSSWIFRDNAFDGTAITCAYNGSLTAGNNAYLIGSNSIPSSGGDRTVSSFGWQSGSLGSFYLPSGSVLLTNGSRSASAAGLYQYTALTNNTKAGSSTVNIGFHYVACTNGTKSALDYDGDSLADYFEDRKGDGTTNQTYNWQVAGTNLRDFELTGNFLVNDPMNDYDTLQNTQYQPKVVALGDTVIVGYWDSNQGVYGLGSSASNGLLNHTNENLVIINSPVRMVAYSVSLDGGRTFADLGVPPLPADGLYGDAGDPVLAVDRINSTFYFAATSERNADANRGIPFWKSDDYGASFARLPTIATNITKSDYPWIAVDEGPGTGSNDVYAIVWRTDAPTDVKLMVATNGLGTAWSTDQPTVITNTASAMPHMAVGTDHTVYVAWKNKDEMKLKIRSLGRRGTPLGAITNIASLNVSYVDSDAWMRLMRTNTSTDPEEYFKGFIGPTLAVNPSTTNTNRAQHLYVVYADKRPTNTTDRSDVFFSYSTNGGQTWANPFVRVNLDSGTNDQWMPTITVRPDGNMLFVGWMDRRNDAGNSMIDAYGRFASIAADGTVSWATNDFRITTQNFPPVFSGTGTNYGSFDPVWPPGGVLLDWWYDWWVDNGDGFWVTTLQGYDHEAGEHNGSCSDMVRVYFVWSDNRVQHTYYSANPSITDAFRTRYQTDIRLARIPWP